MVISLKARPSISQKILRYCCSTAIFRAKIRGILKQTVDLFYGLFLTLTSNTSSSDLCGSKSSSVSTKTLVELAAKPSSSTVNSEEEMGPLDIGYARVSSREQAEDTNALKQQISRLKDANASHILHDVEKGKKDDRPQFQELMQLVEAGKVRTLIITRIDRVTRSLPTLRKLVDKLQKYNVNLIALDQKLDLNSPQGKLMLNILGTLAEWEVDLLSERVINGIKHGRKQGWANGSCPFGYIVIDHKYFLDPTPFLCLVSERPANYLDFYSDSFAGTNVYKLPHRTVAEVARDCVEIYLDKRGVRPTLKTIFEKYGVQKTKAKCNGTDRVLHWTIQGFSRWVRNPVLDGYTCYGKQKQTVDGRVVLAPRQEWTIIPNSHPDQRLLKDGEADEIERIFAANQRSGGGTFCDQEGTHRPHAYQIGLIYCAECGSRAIKKQVYTPKGEYGYYGCRHAGVGCSNHRNVSRTKIEQALIEAIVQKGQSLNQGVELLGSTALFKTERLQKLEDQLAFLEQFPGFNPGAEACKADIQRQIEEEETFLQSQALEDRTVEEVIQMGNSMGIWHTLSGKEKSQIYRRIVYRIFIRDGRVESVVFKGDSALTQLQEEHHADCG